MLKNKIIISILSFYIFWIGVLPFVLTKGLSVFCDNFSHNSQYEIKIKSPQITLNFLPKAILKVEGIDIKAKNDNFELNFENAKVEIRLYPLLLGKVHINWVEIDKFASKVNMKKRFELDKEILKKIEATPFVFDSINVKSFDSKFYHSDISLPVIYKGKDFIFQHKNKYIKFKNQSEFILAGKHSDINIDLFLPKNNDLNKTVFDIKLSNFDLAPLKIYLKHYLPSELLDLKGCINAEANKDMLVATLSECAVVMNDPAKSIILPKTMVLKSKFIIKRQYIDFENIDINAKNINLSLEGRVSDYFGCSMPTLDFNVRVNKSRVEDFVKMLPAFKVEELDAYKLKKYKLYGDVLANFSVKGRLPEPDINGNAYIDDVILIDRIPNTSKGATLKITFKGRSADFDVVIPMGNLEKVYVNGNQDLYNTKFAKMTIKSTDSVSLASTKSILDPLHEILNFIIGPVPIIEIDGQGNIDILVKGNRKNPHIFGILNIIDSKGSFNDINNLELKNSDIKITFNDQNVAFANQTGLLNGKEVMISGVSDLFGKFNFNVVSKDQPTQVLYDSIMSSDLISAYRSLLPRLFNINGLSDIDLKIYGDVKLLNDIEINKNVFVKGDVILKENSFDYENIRISKANGAIKFDTNDLNLDLSAITGESAMNMFVKVKNKIADVSINIPRLNPNKIWEKQLGGRYLLPFVSLDLKYKGAIDNIEFDKINLHSKVLESYKNSELNVNSGNFDIENNKINIKDLKGYIGNNKNTFDINLRVNEAFTEKFSTTGDILVNVLDVSVLNDLFKLEVLPKNLKDILSKYTLKTGKLNIDAKIINNNINAYSNLGGIELVYNPLEMPVSIINGSLLVKNNNLKLNKINMLADEMPILLDGDIKDVLDKQNFNLYFNTKPKQEFIDKYINGSRIYPIKIKGDIVCWIKLKGNIDDFDLKSNLNLSKEASIYYLGATVGDIENAIVLELDSRVLTGKDFKIKDFSYDKLIDSQSGRQTQLNMLKAWGGVELIEDDLNLKDFHIKTQTPTDARIFNIIFRKPNIKQGQFTSNLKFNGNLTDPKVLGDFHIFETDIPFFDTTMKNIELVFKDKAIEIDSKGEVMGNALVFQGTMKNKLSQPYYLEKGLLYTKDLDLNRILNKLKISQVDDVSTFESFDDLKLSALSFKNLKFKADNIRLRNIQATDYEAITSLNDKGVFEVNKFAFNIAQGMLRGNYKYNLKTNDMLLSLDADKISADDITLALFDLKNQIYGDMTGQINLSCNGINFERCMQTLNGNSIFNVKEGKMPKLGSLEYLLKASNLVKSGFTSLSINSVIELISPLKTGDFSDIYGSVRIKDGVAENLEITTKGKDLSLFISGIYNFATSEADMEVYGLLSRKMSSFFGPIGNLSINTLFNVIPGVDLSKENSVLEKINKIPGIEFSSKEFRKFIADIKGDINGDNYVTSFKWIN